MLTFYYSVKVMTLQHIAPAFILEHLTSVLKPTLPHALSF